MGSTPGRIPMLAFKGGAGVLFGVSVMAAIARTAIRIQQNRKLAIDDAFVVFACICLTASFTLLILFTPSIFLEEAIVLNLPVVLTPESIQQLLWLQKVTYSYLVLMWTVIFSVKFAFLFFFRTLVRRMPREIFYWKVVASITALVYAFCVCDVFIPCPHFNFSALRCAANSQFKKTLALSSTIISLDILTDVMIIAIPICVLWKVKIVTRQKVLLGGSLCLSICMIIAALIRFSGIGVAGTSIDITWGVFWQFIEGCIAILMVSLTAFRSLFINDGFKLPQKKAKPMWSSREWIRNRKLREAKKNEIDNNLPAIPSATLTGMRTLIRGGSHPTLTTQTSVDERHFGGSRTLGGVPEYDPRGTMEDCKDFDHV